MAVSKLGLVIAKYEGYFLVIWPLTGGGEKQPCWIGDIAGDGEDKKE